MTSVKRRLAASLVCALCVMLLPSVASAQTQGIDLGMLYVGSMGLPAMDIRDIAVRVIRAALGLVGLVMIMQIIYGGLKVWTHSACAEDRDEAIETIKGAVIGLIIIMTSSSFVHYLVNALADAAGTYL